jgi:hypothetical protein
MRRLTPLALLFISACAPMAPSVSQTSPLPANPPGTPSAGADGSVPATLGSDASAPPASSVCRNPAEHVYHPYRLQVRNPCMTLSGVVDRIKDEPDGDYHVRLRLDPQFASLIDTANLVQQAGDLILEPVCIHAITQADAVSACAGFTNTMTVPPRGTHVIATGAYVLDTDHGWMELHPLWDIHRG